MFLFIFLNIKRVQSLFGKHLYHSFYGFLWRDLSSGGAESNRQSSNLPYSLQNTQSLVTAVNRSNNKSWNQSVWLNALLPSFTYDEKWTNYSCQFTSSSAIVGKPLKPFIPKSGCNVWAPGCYVTMFTRAEMKACAEAVHAHRSVHLTSGQQDKFHIYVPSLELNLFRQHKAHRDTEACPYKALNSWECDPW